MKRYYESIEGIDVRYPGWGRPAQGTLYKIDTPSQQWFIFSYYSGWRKCDPPDDKPGFALVGIGEQRVRKLESAHPPRRFSYKGISLGRAQ